MAQSATLILYLIAIPCILGLAILVETLYTRAQVTRDISCQYASARGIKNRIQYRLFLIRHGKL